MDSLTKRWTRGGLLFGKMWEDSAVELALAEKFGVSKMVSVASSGDTAFALASLPGAEVTAIDINPPQIRLCELKQAILREQGPEALRTLLYSDARPTVQNRTLSPLAKDYWVQHDFLLRDGFHRAGRVDRMMAFWLWLFSKLVVTRENINYLLCSDDVELQRELVSKQWQGWRWNLGIKVAFWRPVLRLIYGAELIERLPLDFGAQMSLRMHHFLTAFEARCNPYLWQTFAASELGESQAPYLDAWGEVDFRVGTLADLEGEGYEFFVLSNILEVADERQTSELLAQVKRLAEPGAIIVLRFMAPRAPIWSEVEYLREESEEAGLADRAFFCNHFQIYRLASA